MDWMMYVLISVLAVMIIIHLLAKKFKINLESKRTHYAAFPTELVRNDKIVSVRNVQKLELIRAVQDFCRLYNDGIYKAIPKLHTISDNEFAITFPFDTEFEIFCYFINYMVYPENIEYSAKVTAWTKVSESDNCPITDLLHKDVMMYIPQNDEEFDNVHLTAFDNKCYKIDFSFEKDTSPLPETIIEFQKYMIDASNLDGEVIDVINNRSN